MNDEIRLRFAKVIPDRTGDRALDYLIPAAMEDQIAPGARVRVPIRSRLILGTVVATTDVSEVQKPKEISEVIGGTPLIRPKLLEIARWIAEYYCCSLEAAMACVLPQVVRKGEVSARRKNHVRVLRRPDEEALAALAKRAPRQADALKAALAPGEPHPVAKLAKTAGVSESVFRALERNGWVKVESVELARDPHGSESFLPTSDLDLNAEQVPALLALQEAVDNPEGAKPILLHGVTGSGKTEIYLQGIRHALKLGKTALVLVPEISLTPQTVERFKSRFSDIQAEVAVLHSHLSAGERHDEWYKIHVGKARIVIGARSAVFAPWTVSGSSSSMRSTNPPTSRRKPPATMPGMWRCSGPSGNIVPSCSEVRPHRSRVGTMPRRESIVSSTCVCGWMTDACRSFGFWICGGRNGALEATQS